MSSREKVVEAVARMRKLQIINDAIDQFIEDGVVMCSEPPLGGLYYLEEDQQRHIEKFEREHDALVYLVIRSFTDFGKMDSFLYVSNYQEEWAADKKDIETGVAFCYTYNYDAPDCSEFGSIGVRSFGGGLLRTA